MIVLCVSKVKCTQRRADWETDRKIWTLMQDAAITIMERLNFVGSIINHRIVCNPFMFEKDWRTIFFDVPTDGISESVKAELDEQLIAKAQKVLPEASVSVAFH